MELGPYQLQIFVSLVVILAAAFVALICDFLRGSNQQLRELAVELRVRREEEQRRTQLLAAAARGMRQPGIQPARPLPVTREKPAAQTRAMEKARPVELRQKPASPENAGVTAHARAQKIAESAPAAPRKSSVIDSAILARVARLGNADGTAGTLAGMEFTETEVLLAPPPPGTQRHGHELIAIAGGRETSSSRPESSLPAGLQDGYVLTRLIQSRRPITGLVVSIGVQSGESRNGDVPESVDGLVRSLIGPDDFASRSGADEYLLIYPRERGDSAQRRLSEIAERLWDFQLRSLGRTSILFSWGGVEVEGETISDAIASATERMSQTRRSRKTVSIQELQRKAV